MDIDDNKYNELMGRLDYLEKIMARKQDDSLKLIVFNNCKDLGNQVNNHIIKLREESPSKSYLVPISHDGFENGESKVKILDSIRQKDVYVLTDVGNYNETYKVYGHLNHMTPDDHYNDIIKLLAANQGHARSISLIMPLLYNSRQHRRKGREGLNCAVALQELVRYGVKNIITFDAHDPSVQNAIPFSAFENFYPTNEILAKVIEDLTIEDLRNLIVVAPDEGAVARARYNAEYFNNQELNLKTNIGTFTKIRDLSKTENGKNRIIYHNYNGESVEGKTVIVVDDMISSGESILETVEALKARKAKKVILITTYAFFTQGIDKFDKYHEKELIDKMYTTNLSYIGYKRDYLEIVDCSLCVAQIINTLNLNKSISSLLNGKDKPLQLLKEKLK